MDIQQDLCMYGMYSMLTYSSLHPILIRYQFESRIEYGRIKVLVEHWTSHDLQTLHFGANLRPSSISKKTCELMTISVRIIIRTKINQIIISLFCGKLEKSVVKVLSRDFCLGWKQIPCKRFSKSLQQFSKSLRLCSLHTLTHPTSRYIGIEIYWVVFPYSMVN